MLLVGDLLQLPPVLAKQIFSVPNNVHHKALYNSSQNLWNAFEVVHLKVNKRQGEGDWNDVLNRYRKGEQTADDNKLLETRRTKHFKNKSLEDAIHVYFKNADVSEYNKNKLSKIDSELITIHADIFDIPGYTSKTSDWGTIESTKFMKHLDIKKDARVMLIHNIKDEISDGLVNGAVGTATDFIFKDVNGQNKIIGVLVNFDDPTIGQYRIKKYKNMSELKKAQNENSLPVFKKDGIVDYSPTSLGKSKKKHGAKCTLIQVPLVLAWASTGHKMQGKTVKKGTDMVCHGSDSTYFPPALGYVMISRCQDFDNLYLEEDFDLNKIRPNQHALKQNAVLEKNCIAQKFKKKTFDIFYVNLRNNKYSNFCDVLLDPCSIQAEVVCLSETWWKPNSEPKWAGRTGYHSSVGNGKGVSVFSKYNLYFFRRIQSIDYQIISLQLKKDIQLTLVYLSSGACKQSVVESLKSIHKPELFQMVIGDFNFSSEDENVIVDYLKHELRLTQAVDGPTHEKGRGIDHIYLQDPYLYCVAKICQRFNYYSDHMSFNIQFMFDDDITDSVDDRDDTILENDNLKGVSETTNNLPKE